MAQHIDNPFANYGGIVCGSRFIGRRDGVQVIENRVIRPKEPGNLAIVGEPRMGKSSLIFHTIMERKNELVMNRTLPIWLNCATFDSASTFFRSLVSSCFDELDDIGYADAAIRKANEAALSDHVSRAEAYSRMQRFFERVRRAEIQVIIILDEFDHARMLFSRDISGFQGLRELSYRPEWRVVFVTASRRSIRDIELQSGAISTLDGIFHKYYLSTFNKEEIAEYFARLNSAGPQLDTPEQERITYYCGGYPYLLDMLGYVIVDRFADIGIMGVDSCANLVSQSILDHYDQIVSLLKEDDKFGTILKIIFGPALNINDMDVQELLKLGLIKMDGEQYRAFSLHFQDYLKLLGRKTDLWPIWGRAEKALRKLIVTGLISHYGGNWLDKLRKARPNLKPTLDRCEDARQRERRSFGTRASVNLIDFAYPGDLFEIIFSEWAIFGKILGKDRPYWNQRSTALSKIRNPLAHNRDEVLQDYEIAIAEGYCGEIIEILSAD